VRSTPGAVSGIDVDGLVLASAPGGAALPLGPGGEIPQSALTIPARAVAATPKVEVTDNGRTKIHLQVTGAAPGTPFWLVLGQSNNAGWEATVAGKDIGGSTLVDGYANGWLVHPRSGNFAVVLEWKPQQRVWIGLVVSGFAILLCLVLAFAGRRRSRAALDTAAARDISPRSASPLLALGCRPGPVGLVGTTVAVVLAASFVSRWWVGLVAGVVVLATLVHPRARVLMTFGAPGALAFCGLYEVVQQYRYGYFPTFEWPRHFDRLNDVAWLAIVLLACDALVEIVRSRAATNGAPTGPPSGSPGEQFPAQGEPNDGAQPPDTPATVPARG
jgi:hypothetical protein